MTPEREAELFTDLKPLIQAVAKLDEKVDRRFETVNATKVNHEPRSQDRPCRCHG
jgi:hypothetical protein